jgi:hypothetical protein
MESPFDDDVSEVSDLANTPSLEQVERYGAKRQRWEENVVKRILAAAGKDRLAPELIRRHFERTNERRLTFDDFNAECHFPMFLGFEKPTFKSLEKAEKQLLEFRKADKNILVKLWCDHHDALSYEYRDCYQGVVFEWLHHGATHKLIHNQYLCTLTYPWTRIAISLPDTLETLYIEDLDSYMMSANWTKQ